MAKLSREPVKKTSVLKQRRAWLFFALLVLVAALTAVAAIFFGGTVQQKPEEGTKDVQNPSASATSPQASAGLGAPTRGDEGAPVVMIESLSRSLAGALAWGVLVVALVAALVLARRRISFRMRSGTSESPQRDKKRISR